MNPRFSCIICSGKVKSPLRGRPKKYCESCAVEQQKKKNLEAREKRKTLGDSAKIPTLLKEASKGDLKALEELSAIQEKINKVIYDKHKVDYINKLESEIRQIQDLRSKFSGKREYRHLKFQEDNLQYELEEARRLPARVFLTKVFETHSLGVLKRF